MKVVIAGSGALGCRFGVMMHRGGHDVTLVDSWQAHVEAIRKDGLHVDFDGEALNVKLPILYPHELTEAPDLMIVLTKSIQLPNMLESVRAAIGPNTAVLSVLNGLGHEDTLCQYVDREQVLIGVTVWTAGLTGPGHIHLANSGTIDLRQVGTSEASIARAKAVVDAMNTSGLNATYNPNVDAAIWRKASLNGFCNSLCTLLDCNLQEQHDLTNAQWLVEAVVSEFAAAAAHRGVQLDTAETSAYILQVCRNVGEHYPSMHQDLVQHKRLTEIDFINGYVARYAEAHGLNAPYNRLITELVHAKEQLLQAK